LNFRFSPSDNRHYENLPTGWILAKVGDVFDLQAGSSIKAIELEEKTKDNFPCYGGNGLRGYIKRCNRDGNHPLIGRQGALCGNINYVSGKFHATEHAVVVDCFAGTNPRWAFYFLIILNLNQYATSTAQPGLAVKTINFVDIPLPPIVEQNRIVDFIETLLATVNDLEKSEANLLSMTIVAKSKILDLAIRGKLVPQDPNDEPASALLERIRSEKKPSDKSQYKNESEFPFYIPENWEWVRLGDISNIIMGQSPDGKSVSESSNGIEFHQGKIFFSKHIINKSNQTTYAPTKIAPANSVLLCVRAPVGKVNIADRELCIGRGLCAIQPLAKMSVKFIFRFLEAFELFFVRKSTGTTFIAITCDVVKNQLVPLPPLVEQHRIVTQIEKLFAQIDTITK